MADQTAHTATCTPNSVESGSEANPSQSTSSHTFKVGDKVKVVEATDGKHCLWDSEMDILVGGEFVVEEVTRNGNCRLKSSVSLYIPATSLAPAEYVPEVGDESLYVVAWNGSRVGLAYRGNLKKLWYVCDCDCYFENMSTYLESMVILEASDMKPEDASKDYLRAIIAKYDMETGELFAAKKTFTPQGTYEERQAQWIKHHGIKVGSNVEMTRPNDDMEDGSTCSGHTRRLYDQRSSIHTVRGIKASYIEIKNSKTANWHVPYKCLQPVTD